MFGKHTTGDSPAAEAWHELRDIAADRAKDLGDHARHKLSDVGGEARRRAGIAWDVLAGRPAPARKWPMIRAGLIGVAVGWGVAELYRRRRQEVNQAMAQLTGELREVKSTMNERLAKAKATPGSPMDKAKAAVGRSNATTPDSPRVVSGRGGQSARPRPVSGDAA